MADQSIQSLAQRVQLLGSIVNRVNMFSRLGYAYGGDRDLYEALGWKAFLDEEDYHSQYSRNAIAAAVIDRPVNATWRGDLVLREPGDEDETDFEKAWIALNKSLSIKSKFSRLDKLVGLGEYAILLFGFDDVSTTEGWQQPVKAGQRELVYIKPISKKSAGIAEYVNSPNDPRYGLPLYYNVSVALASGDQVISLKVHYTRVMHVAGALMESEVAGIPRLKPVFNNITDIEKLSGGSAEMFWRGARPGYQAKVDPEYTMTTDTKEDLEEQIDEYEHNLRRILVNEGVSYEPLASQVSDPSSHLDIQLQLISAQTEIPKRILTGSERGELASSQDDDNWNNTIKARREEYAEPSIVRPFVDRCIQLQILPKPKTESYEVDWTDLWSQSDQEKATVGKTRSESWRNYSESPAAQELLPLEAAYSILLGLSDAEVEYITELRQKALDETVTDVDDIMGDEEEEDESTIIETDGGSNERA